MSGYLRLIEKEFDFENRTVKVEIKPLRYEHFLKLESVTDKTNHAEALSFLLALVREYVTLVVPPKAVDGSSVSLEEICTSAYFTSLVMKLGYAVITSGKIVDPLVLGESLPSGLEVVSTRLNSGETQ